MLLNSGNRSISLPLLSPPPTSPTRHPPPFSSTMAASNQQWNGNIWIHDNWTDEEKAQALNRLSSNDQTTATHEQLEMQQRAFNQFRRNAGTNWNVFYEQNQNKFFKDRHYLHKAFPLEFGWLYPDSDGVENGGGQDDDDDDATDACGEKNSCTSQQSWQYWSKNEQVHIVEIGCGVGNAILPLLEQHTRLVQQKWDTDKMPHLHIHCLDFAPNAIQILKQDERFKAAAGEGRATAHVYDLSAMDPSTIHINDQKSLANSADVAILLFCLSAIGPHPSTALARAARHVMDMLKPGGILIIRDYGRLDEAQLKLAKSNKELGDNFYQKGDGTGVCYFELNDLRELFGNDSFSDSNDKLDVLELDYIQRVYRNRGDGTTRRRVWVQGRFQKPLSVAGEGSEIIQSTNNNTLMQAFLDSSIQRWDEYYKMQQHRLQPESLSEALASKYPNNLLQIFPNEFEQWRSLLDSSKSSKRKLHSDQSTQSDLPLETKPGVTVIDVGCGLGNGTLLNILAKQRVQTEQSESEPHICDPSRRYPRLSTHFIDASIEAIEKLSIDVRYKYAESGKDGVSLSYITSRVTDITTTNLAEAISKDLGSSGDFALLLFTLSSLGPYQEPKSIQQSSKLVCALNNIKITLKPGGIVLLRDFGRYDDDQIQLNSCYESRICDNFYFRDDATSNGEANGTAVYFFTLDEIHELFTSAGFEVLQLEYITRPYSKSGKQSKNLSVNGGAVKRTRIWVHGRFRKVEL